MRDRDLRWVLTLAVTENMSEAAARLGTSQPTLSRTITRVEQEVGARLFDRIGGRLRLNDHGRVFCAHVDRALGELDAAKARLALRDDPERGLVRIAFMSSLGNAVVPRLLRAHRQLSPGTRFELREGNVAAVAEWLRAGDTDLALATRPRPLTGLAWTPVVREQLCLAVAPEHRFARRATVRLREAAEETFVAFRMYGELRTHTDQLCRKAGFAPLISVETGEIATARALAAAGLGVAVVPAPHTPQSAADAPVHIPLRDDGAERWLGIAHLRDRVPPPPIARFLDFATSTDW